MSVEPTCPGHGWNKDSYHANPRECPEAAEWHAERNREVRRMAIQTIAELDRGLEIIRLQLRAGQFMDAKQTAEKCRELVKLQDTLFTAYFRSVST